MALAEVYDATPPGTYNPSLPRLVNVSARALVGSGGDILIAGFVVGGSTSKTVLIRASGPALAAFGVAGFLPDPVLTLYGSAAGGAPLALNSGWGGSGAIASAAVLGRRIPLANASSADSALVVTLAPGAYTAQVAGRAPTPASPSSRSTRSPEGPGQPPTSWLNSITLPLRNTTRKWSYVLTGPTG